MPFESIDFEAIVNKVADDDAAALEQLRSVVAAGSYTDLAGNFWEVTCQDPQKLQALKFPIRSLGVSTSSNVNTANYNLHCGCLFWLKRRHFQELTVEYRIEDVQLRCFHGHDLRIRVATRHGKPADLSRYTKDVYQRPTPSA